MLLDKAIRLLALPAFLFACGAVPAVAQSSDPKAPLPLWELGAGVLGRISTDYPGGRDYAGSAAPVPYIRYRGKILELGGEDALKIVPIRTERFELGFSLDSSKRVTNRATTLGAIAPDVDALVEFGPEIIFRFADSLQAFGRDLPGRLELLVQTRGVFSIDDGLSGVGYEGALARPALRYRLYGTLNPAAASRSAWARFSPLGACRRTTMRSRTTKPMAATWAPNCAAPSAIQSPGASSCVPVRR